MPLSWVAKDKKYVPSKRSGEDEIVRSNSSGGSLSSLILVSITRNSTVTIVPKPSLARARTSEKVRRDKSALVSSPENERIILVPRKPPGVMPEKFII